MRRTRLLTSLPVIVALVGLIMPAPLTSQEQLTKHHRYRLIDLGTFGGPGSFFNDEGDAVNMRGTAVGGSQTGIPDLPDSNPFPCGPGGFIYHAFLTEEETVRDLGTLAGDERCSNAQMLNEQGDVVGNSEINTDDPILGFHEIRAVRWRNGHIVDLGTLGGNNSAANMTNNSGQIVGFAMNGTPDPFSLFAFFFFGSSNGTQTRGFLWQDGVMHDLGTLGVPDAWAVSINDHGQITGFSYTNSTPNSTTGLPTVDPFFWEDGKIVDLGTLGENFGRCTSMSEVR